MIVAYTGSCHRSEKYWAKPNEFYPENFLDENGLLKKDIEGYVPFSIGMLSVLTLKFVRKISS